MQNGEVAKATRGPGSRSGPEKSRHFPRQTPYKRTYPSGRVVWVARYLDLEGKARYAKPRWHGGKSSFALRREAQRAIDEALGEVHSAPRGAWGRTEP